MSRIPRSVDVVVVGGGPAGSAAANVLASRGRDVLLLERARHPRPLVGESVLPMVWKYTDMLGATAAVEEAGFIAKGGGTVRWNGTLREIRFSEFGYDRPGLHVERDAFDDILLRAAEGRGATVREEVAATDVDFEGARPRVTWRRETGGEAAGETGVVECGQVIDASGQSAVIARRLGFREFDRDLRFMSVWGYFGRTDYVAAGGAIEPWERRRDVRPTTFIEQIGAWGWCWHIVQREQVSVGLVLSPPELARFKASGESLEERFLRTLADVPAMADLVDLDTLLPGSVTGIRDFAYYPARLSGDGWIVAGDAAAFVDPINSSGVLGALYTGTMAALAADESLRHPARADATRARYDGLLRGCMAVYRMSAVPTGANSYEEMDGNALNFIKQLGPAERELIVTQMRMIGREENLEPVYALDPAFPRLDTQRLRTLERLVRGG